ncbi:5575_t:CDS:2 [Entrophospora sp. SA101]|nr:3362_t:CDS:2 [Entrophospora sp. SA101]CAJ0887418.1 5575_t:CDS:2 [Entrophospora sp. SA101]
MSSRKAKFVLDEDLLNLAREHFLRQEKKSFLLVTRLSKVLRSQAKTFCQNPPGQSGSHHGPNSVFTADETIRPKNFPKLTRSQTCNSSGSAYLNTVIEVEANQPSIGVPNDNITGVGRGAPACNGSNIQNYQLHILAAELFNGALTGIPNG